MALILAAVDAVERWERCMCGNPKPSDWSWTIEKIDAAEDYLNDLERRALAPCPQPRKRISMNQSEWEEVFPDIPWVLH